MEDPIKKDSAQPDPSKPSIDDVLKKMEKGSVASPSSEKDKEQLEKLKDVLFEADASAQGIHASATMPKKEFVLSPNVERLKEMIKKYQGQKA